MNLVSQDGRGTIATYKSAPLLNQISYYLQELDCLLATILLCLGGHVTNLLIYGFALPQTMVD